MKLIELLNVISDRNEVGVYYRDKWDCLVNVGYYNGKDSIDEKFNKCEVLNVMPTLNDEGKVCTDVIIDGFENYSTWLDITYSLEINLDCPIACEWKDVQSDFNEYAKEIIARVPKTLNLGGKVFTIDSTNVDTGHYFEMIE